MIILLDFRRLLFDRKTMKREKSSVREEDRVAPRLRIKKSEFEMETKEHDPTLPGVFVFCGSRGSGKTYACVSMCRHFEEKGYVTRTFLLCPTAQSNTLYSNLETLDDSDTCDEEKYFHGFLEYVLSSVKEDWEEHREEKRYEKLWQRAQKGDPYMTMEQEHILERHGYHPPDRKRLEQPSHLLVVDDAQGTRLFTDARDDLMSHMVIKHRHIPITLCFLMQSWTGLPRVIRLNATHFILYKTHDKKQLVQLYEAFGTLVTFDAFEKMYKEATGTPHGFLYIDTVPKSDHQRFRNGFNTYFTEETAIKDGSEQTEKKKKRKKNVPEKETPEHVESEESQEETDDHSVRPPRQHSRG
jgi:hypothetical protein